MIKILRNKLFKHFFPGLITWISELIDTLTLTLQVCSFYLSHLSFYLSSRYRSQTRLQNDDFLTFSAIHSTFWHERTNTIKTNFKKDMENSWNRSPRKKKYIILLVIFQVTPKIAMMKYVSFSCDSLYSHVLFPDLS